MLLKEMRFRPINQLQQSHQDTKRGLLSVSIAFSHSFEIYSSIKSITS